MLGGGLRDIHPELADGELRHLGVLLARVGGPVRRAVEEVRVHLVVDAAGADVGLRAAHLRVVHVGAREQQHEAGRLAVGHRQRVDLLLRDHLRDLGARHLDDRRLAGDGDRLLQALQLHLEVLPQLQPDRDGEARRRPRSQSPAAPPSARRCRAGVPRTGTGRHLRSRCCAWCRFRCCAMSATRRAVRRPAHRSRCLESGRRPARAPAPRVRPSPREPARTRSDTSASHKKALPTSSALLGSTG